MGHSAATKTQKDLQQVSFRPFENNDQGTTIPVVLAELKNGPVRLHRPKFVQRRVANTITPNNNTQELCRTPLMLCYC